MSRCCGVEYIRVVWGPGSCRQDLCLKSGHFHPQELFRMKAYGVKSVCCFTQMLTNCGSSESGLFAPNNHPWVPQEVGLR